MKKRPYHMVARAAAAEETRRRIVDATVELFREQDPDDITLETIAARAGVTLQTVLRRFGTKEGVFAAAAEDKSTEVALSREPEPGGDWRAAMRALVASYEDMGDINWRLLRFEAQNVTLRKLLIDARAKHRAWIERTFAADIPRRGAARERVIDALFAATDFYIWKLYRVDLGRSRNATEKFMMRFVDAVAIAFGNRGRR